MAEKMVQSQPKLMQNYKPKKVPEMLSDPVISTLAEKYSKTPAQIASRFLVQRGVSVIPKSVNPQRIKENFNIFDFTLSDDDMDALYELEIGEAGRVSDFKAAGGMDKHPDFPM